VAAGMCYASIGSDTAGSIRLPAAYCGIVGVKPTYGLVPLRGVVPLSTSYDHVGPLTRTVWDAATVLRVIAGYDPQDTTSSRMLAEDYAHALERPPEPFRIGVAREFFFADLDHGVSAQVEQALRDLRQFGDLREVSMPVDHDRTVFNAESYAYHAERVEKSLELFDPETLRRIRNGEGVTAAEYIEKRQELDVIRRNAVKLFEDVDVIVTPTVAIPPPTIAELLSDPTQLRPRELVMLRNTRPFNVLGVPAVSVPCGLVGGLPVGLQIAAPPWSESTALRLADLYLQAVPWSARLQSMIAASVQ
jgi:Asp-tRNA(Asn)/Glu-tRNA(Gln) amidotransferase A subunit family amidase